MLLTSLILCVSGFETEPAWPGYGGPDGDFVIKSAGPAADAALGRLWSIKPGSGRAAPAVADGIAYLPFSRPVDGEEATKVGEEGVAAVRLKDGTIVWQVSERVERLDEQENFSGAPMSPQATPTFLPAPEGADGGPSVVTLGFTGRLIARAAANGEERWRIDLVKRYGGRPVQFGFSGSPLAVDGDLLICPGGPEAGTVRLNREGE
ncbi:MAG: hypothetical protein AAF907_07010, partial [Planctomycetota bacterium]